MGPHNCLNHARSSQGREGEKRAERRKRAGGSQEAAGGRGEGRREAGEVVRRGGAELEMDGTCDVNALNDSNACQYCLFILLFRNNQVKPTSDIGNLKVDP